jgi:tRNA modification GTPase
MDTIFALASARGRAGVSVVRISGPGADGALAALCGPLPVVRVATLRTVRIGGEAVDRALVVRFAQGASFTGEAVVELHLHGSVAIVSAVLAALGRMEGLRLAEPGEFTRRALENDRLDLAQVEGLGDLIAAETEAQRRQAMRLFAGELGVRAAAWRGRALSICARIEASIDFAEEEIPADLEAGLGLEILKLAEELESQARGQGAAERIREGFEVAIIGAPNSGKSTLLNRLAGREAAITSAIAGTTRDVIEVRMDVEGLAVTLLDTAGLRESVDPIEKIGIERSLARAAHADLRVHLIDPGDATRAGTERLVSDQDIVIYGKYDVHGRLPGVSGLTGEGVEALVAEIAARLAPRAAGAGLAVRERHRVALEGAAVALRAAAAAQAIEMRAEELRVAMARLDAIVGRVDVEHILGEIFANFCIGK